MKNIRSFFVYGALVVTISAIAHPARCASADENLAHLKKHLVSTIENMLSVASDFKSNAEKYSDIMGRLNRTNSAESATAADIQSLIEAMRQNYKDMDSFAYETIEGIVAGVSSLAQHDIILDAGVPGGEGAPDEVAEYTLSLANGKKLVNPGALFTYVIEPTLWGSRADFLSEQKVQNMRLPCPEVLAAAADELQKRISQLLQDARAWQPTTQDLIGALLQMTPTLGDYFDEWKESRYSGEKSGLFSAVSRVSDMKGIIGSCRDMFVAIAPVVGEKNPSLRDAVERQFREILEFLDEIEQREKNDQISPDEAEELGSVARRRTDALMPLLEQIELALASN